MLDKKRVELGGHSYMIEKLATGQGLKVLARVTKIMGPAFGAAFKTLDKDAQVTMGSLGVHGIGELIAQLSERISPDELADLTEIFVSQTKWMKDENTFIPLKSVYASHFAGDYGSLFGLLVEHINFNFASFFAGLGITAPQS